MAKKIKDDTQAPNPNNIVNRDIMQRLNFMYQASVYLSSVLPLPSPSTTTTPRKRAKRTRKMGVHDLSKSYINSMKIVANKTMVKMDPAVKRTLCNGCNIVLIPGSTATVRVKSSKVHGHVMHYRCNSCKSTRRIPAPPTLNPIPDSSSTNAAPHMDVVMPNTAPAAALDTAMEVDATESSQKKRRRKAGPEPRLPRLYAREGHIVLCGNDNLKLPETQTGDGIYI
ncbi:RNAse P Rpr2/Rpp21/SNM1 subunit domain-containing protein, partial [Favolaschia claudopus]